MRVSLNSPLTYAVSTQTLSEENDVKIGVSIQPHLSCSVAEGVNLRLRLLWTSEQPPFHAPAEEKRQRRGEVLRTVFVCHRVPFLIPQAPAMPAGAALWGREPAQSTPSSSFFFFFFSLLLSKWRRGGWVPEKARLSPVNPAHPLPPQTSELRTFPAREEMTHDYPLS